MTLMTLKIPMGELVDVNIHSLQYMRMNHNCESFVKEIFIREFSLKGVCFLLDQKTGYSTLVDEENTVDRIIQDKYILVVCTRTIQIAISKHLFQSTCQQEALACHIPGSGQHSHHICSFFRCSKTLQRNAGCNFGDGRSIGNHSRVADHGGGNVIDADVEFGQASGEIFHHSRETTF